jgi:UDP-glucose 4-epimerase
MPNTDRAANADSPRRVIVTGGAGFIGSHVADKFLERGYEVVVVDDLSTGSEENIPAAARFERLDLVDAERLDALVKEFRPSAIAHLGAQSSVTVSVKDPDRDLASNVNGTFNVCQSAKDVRAPVVFASTGGALYGDRAPLPTAEDAVSPEPLAPYGASKLAGEAYVATWGRLHDLPNVVLRLGNVFGPRQNPHGEAGVVAIFSEKLLHGETPTVFGDGSQTRDYIHVSDVADAFVLASEGGRAGTFNVGRGEEMSVNDLLAVLQDAAGTTVEPRYEPLRAGELRRSALDSTRLQETLDWRPQVALDDGLAETFRTYAGASAQAAS